MQSNNDETLNNDATDSREEKQVRWDCFSCGKHLGEQGDGGSFTLDFGYGSGLDTTRGINGWICDECVAQKHGRLRVSDGAKGMEYWLEKHQLPLAEHDDAKYVRDLDYFGRKRLPWSVDHKGNPYTIKGWRLYTAITSEERSRVETWLFNEEPLDRGIVVKLLQALMESEGERAEAESRRWEAEREALDRARQQAERLSAEELAQLRVREAKRAMTPEETRRLWEHAEWNENHFREQQEAMREQKNRIKELEGEVAGLKKRLGR